MNKQEIKEKLEANLKTITNLYETLRQYYEALFEEKVEMNKLQSELQAKKQEHTLFVNGLSKDEQKEYGSNEATREAKFKQENSVLIAAIEHSTSVYNKTQEVINNYNSLLSQAKYEKDILICLAGLEA